MKWQSILPTSSDLGLRFNLAGTLPTTFLAVFVIALCWSGAPSEPPSWTRLLASARDLKPGEAVLLVIVILLVALLGQPLQRPLVRFVEGYWVQHPRVPAWLGIAACRGQQRRFNKLWKLAFTDPPGEQDTPTGEIDRAYYRLRIRRSGHADPDYQQVWRAPTTTESRRLPRPLGPHFGGPAASDALQDLQIVNGGQTTASIHAASRKKEIDLSRVFVQMKSSIVDHSRSTEVVPKISEFANSQNRVNAADFFANHPFHVRMEEFSRRISAPSPDGTFRELKWFYERARGQYQDARA